MTPGIAHLKRLMGIPPDDTSMISSWLNGLGSVEEAWEDCTWSTWLLQILRALDFERYRKAKVLYDRLSAQAAAQCDKEKAAAWKRRKEEGITIAELCSLLADADERWVAKHHQIAAIIRLEFNPFVKSGLW